MTRETPPPPAAARVAPRSSADEGHVLCDECLGERLCWACSGRGRIRENDCMLCHGFRWCIVCRGSGQILAPGAT